MLVRQPTCPCRIAGEGRISARAVRMADIFISYARAIPAATATWRSGSARRSKSRVICRTSMHGKSLAVATSFPSFDSSEDPDEGFGIGVGFFNEPVDG